MRRFRIMGLCLVAAFAMSAIATASASAAPEYYQAKSSCTKAFGPVWSGGTCPKTGKVLAATKITYTSKGGTSHLEGGLEITCSSDESKGDIEGSKKTVKLKLTYLGCKETAHPATPCESKTTVLEKITTEFIKGELTDASETFGGATTTVNRLEPESVTKPYFAKFVCGTTGHTINVEVKGKIFVGIAPVLASPEVGKLSLTGEAINQAQGPVAGCGWATGAQRYLYENGAGACQHLKVVENTAELEPSGNISKDTVTYKTAIETVE
jgi:hypothetical protein